MTKKLTKNDSMSVEKPNPDLNKENVLSYIDVAIASFEAVLNISNARKYYFNEWKKNHKYSLKADPFDVWCTWAKLVTPELWISGAFTWNETKKGLEFWQMINSTWLTWLNQNLKK